jgi:hypothetical protein
LPVLLGLVKDGKVCFSPLVFSTWRMHALCYFLSVRIELSTSRFTCTRYTPTTWCIDYYYIYGVGSHLQYKVQFVWMNQEDDKEVGIFLISYIFLDLFCRRMLINLLRLLLCTLYRKRQCLMLQRWQCYCCRFCIWWQCYYCHGLICCCFQDHLVMVTSRKYRTVSTKNYYKNIGKHLQIMYKWWQPQNMLTYFSIN